MRSTRRAAGAILALASAVTATVALGAAPASAAAITYTVTSTGDASDATPGNGTCATAGAVCTLRAAIEEINAGSSANTYTIVFGVAGTTQVGATELPSMIRTTTIDGSTAPGYTVAGGPTFTVRCESQAEATAPYGLSFAAPASTLRGLRLVNCSTAVITSSAATGLKVVGNHIGHDGSTFSATNAVVLGVSLNGSGSIVGGTTAADRNVISGESFAAVSVRSTATGSTIAGNHLGTNAAGTAAIRNPSPVTGGSGSSSAAAVQTEASTTAITGNLISGNPSVGVSIVGGTATVKGNLIGTDVTGTTGIGNGSTSVLVWPGATATIGGTGVGEGNVLAWYLAPSSSTFAPHIRIEGATATVLGNKIGTNAAGTAGLCTTGSSFAMVGIAVSPSDAGVGSNVTIGGSAAGAGNVISGCRNGIVVARKSSQAAGSSTVTIRGNRIGTDAAGSTAIAPSTDDLNSHGIQVGLHQAVTIGGAGAGEGNVISGNGVGVEVADNRSGVTIQGNRIGTNAAGTAAIPNSYAGIRVIGSLPAPTQGNKDPILIGGPAAGAGNLISGNDGDGLAVATPATIQGNRIGTNAAGTAAIPNTGLYGANLNNKDILFGGTAAGEGNLVSGHPYVGVGIAPSIAVPKVYGNQIGTDAAGTGAIPNVGSGVSLASGTTGSLGGTAAGQANLIAFNTGAGVRVSGSTAVDIRGNLVHSSTGLNIDLFQHGEAINVGNHDQIHPTLTTATVGASATSVAGTVTSDRTGTILVDVYAGTTCQAAFGAGEAKQFLGTISVPYPVAGAATAFSGSVAKATVGTVITATSTIAGNGTSQLSTCAPYSDIQISTKDTYATAPIGTEVATEVKVTNAGPQPVSSLTVGLSIPVGEANFSAVDAGTIDPPSVGSVSSSTSVWTIPSLAAGASATVCLRGEIVRADYTYEPIPGVPVTFATTWSPQATLKSGAVDPYTGNNVGYGFTQVGAAASGASVCPLPSVAIDDASLVRPASGTAPMSFTVRLSKAQARAVTVGYRTVNGKAVAVEDYVATTGTVTFAAGETSKTISVPIVGSQSDEPDKAFTVVLSAPVHATLADASATGTVKANFLLQGCPPGSTANQRFVCHLYFDALGRAPESGGFTYWVNKLNGGTSRATMAKSYLTQPESLRKVANRAYVLYLGRNGTSTELSGWATKLANKTATTQDIRIAVLASGEYYAKVGGTNDAYIRQMFFDVFRRNVDSSGLAYWTGQLAAGKTRTNVATRFMAEPEGRRKIVGDIFLRFLRREPTTTEANGWVSQLAAGKTEVDVGIGLVASSEYYARPSS